MKRWLLTTLVVGLMLNGFAQDCADCSISIPQLPDPETVGSTTIYEFSSTGIENDCFGTTSNPSWAISGSASILSGANSETVRLSATGPFELTLTTDYSGGSQSCTLETASNIAENPDFEISCGLDVIVVLDESNSISAQEEAGVRAAVNSFVNALDGTGSNIAIVEFGTYAEAEVLPGCNLSGAGSPNYVEINQSSINGCIATYLQADYGITPSGGTNWDDAFYMVQDVINNNTIQPDIVLFFTDGNPTYYIDESNGNALGGSGSTSYTGSVNHAIVQANVVKQSAHLFVVGVGDGINEENIKMISGIDGNTGDLITDDYVIAPDFNSLANDFFLIALAACGTDVSLDKTGPSCVEEDNLEFEYVVSFENEGSQPARSVEITDVMPSGYNVVSQIRNPVVGSVSNIGNVYTWDYGILGVGGSATWTFTVQRPLNSPPGTNTAYIGSSNIYPETDDTASITTTVNDIAITGVITENLCGAVDIGAIDLSVTGGSPPYTFSWSNGASTEDISGLAAGTYSVTITDIYGCDADEEFIIDESTDVTVTLNPSVLACGNIICNGSDDGSIDAVINGGTAPYTYSWTGTGQFSASTEDVSGLGAGTYTLDVIDVNGCEGSASVSLTEPPALIVSESHTDVSCYDDNGPGSDGSINVSVDGGCPPYSFSWSNGATTEDISGLPTGSYTITVTDANTCSDQITIFIDQPQQLSITETHTNVVCNDGSGTSDDGTINITVSGGTLPYSYNWSNDEFTEDLQNLAAGSYTVIVTDANDCVASITVVITQPGGLTITESHVDVTCNDDSGTSDDGSIDIGVSGGTAPYTYAWSNGASSEDLSSLAAGIYTVTVSDANDCSASISITIEQPEQLSLSETHTDVICNDDNGTSDDGTIDLSVEGGTTPYTYAWSNGASSEDLSSLAAGTYTVTVSDANDCSASISITIEQPDQLSLSETHTDVICNDDNGTSDDGTIDLSVEGGTTPYTYAWSNGASTEDLSSLAAGAYTVTVTDANDCSASISITIEQPEQLSLSETHTDVICNDDNGTSDDGTIDLSVEGGTTPYTYAWSNGASSEDVSSLAAGTYTVIVTDASDCSASISVTIEQPEQLSLSETHTDVICNDDNGTSDDGTIDLSVEGGTTPYTYSWSNGASSEDVSSLAAGTYTVIVTDASDCSASISVTIEQPDQLSLSETHTDVICNDDNGTSDDGTIDLSVEGGTTPYTYAWSNGASSEDLSSLAAGTYTVTVSDANDCSASISVTIEQPEQLSLSETHTDVICNDDNGTSDDGTIDLSVEGGTTPFTYAWSNGASTEDLSSLAAGTYTVTVSDANDCSASISITIEQPEQLSLSETHTDVICNDDNGTSDDGTIDLSVEGGTTPYTYAWSNGASSEDLSSLAAGTYTVIVTDGNDCSASISVTIEQPDQLSLSETHTDVICNDDNGTSDDGTIDLSVEGGTTPYTYAWSNGASSEDLSSLAAGTYTVTVSDANDCSASISVTIEQPEQLSLSETHTDVICNDDNGTSDDGTIDLSVEGGTTPYTYSWSNGASSEDLSSLAAGTYTVIVTDASDCSASISVTIEQPEQLSLSETHTDVICNDDNGTSDDGTIDLSVVGGTTPYTYAWSNGASSEDLSSLAAGTYAVTVTDGNDCSASISVTIEQPEQLLLSESHNDVTCNDDNGPSNDGSINLSVNGGTAPYSYSWSNFEVSQDINGLAAGSYSVIVTDANGCTAELTAVIEEPELLQIAETHTNVSCVSGGGSTNDGSIDVTVTGGTPPYIYAWNPLSNDEDLTGLSAGTYTLMVMDANLCRATISIVIDAPGSLVLTETHEDANCDINGNAGTGSIDLTVDGGVTPVTYEWSNGQITEDVSDLEPGNYTVVVTDANGCMAGLSISIANNSNPPNVLAQGGVLTCSDESVQLASAAPPGASYVWAGPDNFTSNEQNPVVSAAGTYTLTVTDAQTGCAASTSVEVTQDIEEPGAAANGGGELNCSVLSIELTGSSPTPGVTYMWEFNGVTIQGSQTAIVDEAGEYTLTVTNPVNGCTSTDVVTVTESSDLPGASATGGQLTCKTTALMILGSTDAQDVTYSWTGPGNFSSNEQNPIVIEQGTYTLTVIDNTNGCESTAAAIVTQDLEAPIASANGGVLTCANTSVQLSANSDGIDVMYSWEGPNDFSSSDQNPVVTEEGTYTVSVSYIENGCSSNATAVVTTDIEEPTASAIGGELTCDITSVTINGSTSEDDAGWSWTGPGNFTSSSEDPVVSVPGTYEATVTDNSNGCTTTTSADVTQNNEEVQLQLSSIDVTCEGAANGAVSVTITGGNGPFDIEWSTGGTTATITDLNAGDYSVTVTAPNGCTASGSVSVNEAEGISLSESHTDVICGEEENGSIDLTVSGGTPPYSYDWSNGADSEDIDGLGAGTYSVEVTDINECTATLEVTISEPAPFTVSVTSISEYLCGNVSCLGESDGSIDITVEGGNGPFTYDWSNGSSDEDQSDLSAGEYSVTVTDANGCQASASATITGPEPIVLEIDSVSVYPNGGNVSCIGAADGFIDVSITGGCPPYQITWSNGAATEDISNLGAGEYTIEVIDASGCQVSAGFVIDEPDPINIFVEIQVPSDELCEGETTMLIAGGSFEDYQWLMNGDTIPGATDPTLEVGITGEFTVLVEDLGICVQGASTPITVTVYPTIKVEMNLSGDTLLCDGGEVEIMTSEGFMMYEWYQDGELIQGANGPVYVANEEGTYTVTAIDSNGCPSLSDDELTIEFGESEDPVIFQSGLLLCPGGGTVMVWSEEGFVSYEWYYEGELIEGENGIFIEVDEEGEYTVITTDAQGCSGSASIVVTFETIIVNTDTVYTEIIELEGHELCLDDEVLDLFGDLIVSVTICQEPQFVDYTYDIDGATICFEFDRENEEANSDTICVIVCDNSICGICDTTIIVINLPDVDDPPVAIEECVEVEANDEISVEVLVNDSDPDGDDIYVSNVFDGPQFGTAIIEGGGESILYIPDVDYCGEDTFYYEVCDLDNAGCDTAFVCVTVLCDCFIPNVLTPNNDGLNDVFEVECLWQIEGAVLRVYNRWGNEVFNIDNYRNDWRGTYRDKPLPEGTYYFIINFTDHQGQAIDLAGDLTILR